MLEKIEKILDLLMKVVKFVAVFMFGVIFVVGLGQIIMRWIFNKPLAWSEEFMRMVFVWVCYSGWAICAQKKEHIRISVFVDKFGKKTQKIIETFDNLLVLLFSVLMVVYGIELTNSTWVSTSFTIKFLNYGMVYLACPFCNLIISAYALLDIIKVWKKPVKEVA